MTSVATPPGTRYRGRPRSGRGTNGQLVLSDVEPAVRATMKRAGYLDRLGEAYVLSADPAIGASTHAAYAIAQQWQTQLLQTGEQADRGPEGEQSGLRMECADERDPRA